MNDEWNVTACLAVRIVRLSARARTLRRSDGVTRIGVAVAAPIENRQLDGNDAVSLEIVLKVFPGSASGPDLPAFVVPAVG